MSLVIKLPYPRRVSSLTVEEALLLRRSIREFRDQPVKLEDLALILWASYGVSEPREGLLTTPSAGATYPLRVYVAVGSNGLLSSEGFIEAGVYRYDNVKHTMVLLKRGDVRRELSRAALTQEYVATAPLSIVLTAIYERTTSVYGRRGELRYVPMEAGHASQNIYLMATSLGYGTVAIGAFRDRDVSSIIGVDGGETPLYIMPIGIPLTARRVSFDSLAEYFQGAP